MKLPALSLGIEEEYQIVDPEIREPAPTSGSSADRQLETLRRSGDVTAVVDRLIEESREGCG